MQPGDLVDVADASEPFDYSILPASVSVLLGYVGMPGDTPHIWTPAEVDKVAAAGLTWGPIVTVAERALTAADGAAAAAWMIGELRALQYPRGLPVFMDIEHVAYLDDPAGAESCVKAWAAAMTSAGWAICVPYLPLSAGHGWVASWTGVRPTSLPGTWAGQQYTGGQNQDRYDLSVMRASLWAGTGDITMADAASLSAQITAETSAIVDEIRTARADVTKALAAAQAGTVANIISRLSGFTPDQVTQIEQAVTAVLTGGTNNVG